MSSTTLAAPLPREAVSPRTVRGASLAPRIVASPPAGDPGSMSS